MLSNVPVTPYFDEESFVTLEDGTSIRCLTKSSVPPGRPDPPSNVVLLHGAGMCAFSWALCAQRLGAVSKVYSIEFRAHGKSSGRSEDLSIDVLVNDVVSCVHLLGLKDFFLIGHSLGGSVAIRVAAALPSNVVLGITVMDMIEGTAVKALENMGAYLRCRPVVFSRPQEAIHWFVTGGGMKNNLSAALSVPHLLKEIPSPESGPPMLGWITDLGATSNHWERWFVGCNSILLGLHIPKLLLVASTDRLDKEMTIAQMQGKFQLCVVKNVGHYMMEDDPNEVSAKLIEWVQHIEKVNKVLKDKLARAASDT
eukprot:PhF_6_TR29242/c0_g1_i1/m.42799/K13617/PPME1; protein phosphatase methylesterase 1